MTKTRRRSSVPLMQQAAVLGKTVRDFAISTVIRKARHVIQEA